ncbi:hypothetical protein BpHYR1_044160 [Brachionus plicatilis]|uniref:Uncharacterized protein n=1 Tax=Brachionus plicatilis TaxID=10195 RepID=A0A3M7T169_BRAPC|nr:hypothetical protein BpHYR1_044160 [Brachionus plicatilis]
MDGEAEPVRSGPKPTPDDKKLSKLALRGSIVIPECIGEIKRPDFGTLEVRCTGLKRPVPAPVQTIAPAPDAENQDPKNVDVADEL